MKLKKILSAHHSFTTTESLAGNLGDGYLLAHNPIFRSIRNATQQYNLKISATRFHHYDSLPLTQLPRILAQQTIPFVDNVMALREIERAAPGVFQLAEVPPLRANYILHESAHAVARVLRLKHLEYSSDTKKTLKTLANQRELALATLLEESFANAVESLMSIYSASEIHEEFLRKNTYIVEDHVTREGLRASVKTIGFASTFRLVVISFLYANLLKTKISNSEFMRILTIALSGEEKRQIKLSKKQISNLKAVFEGGFDLDPVFTIRTNQFCLRLMGIKTKLPKLFSFDVLTYFQKDDRYLNLLRGMSDVVGELIQP